MTRPLRPRVLGEALGTQRRAPFNIQPLSLPSEPFSFPSPHPEPPRLSPAQPHPALRNAAAAPRWAAMQRCPPDPHVPPHPSSPAHLQGESPPPRYRCRTPAGRWRGGGIVCESCRCCHPPRVGRERPSRIALISSSEAQGRMLPSDRRQSRRQKGVGSLIREPRCQRGQGKSLTLLHGMGNGRNQPTWQLRLQPALRCCVPPALEPTLVCSQHSLPPLSCNKIVMQRLLFCLLLWYCLSPSSPATPLYIIAEFHLSFYCSGIQYCEILLQFSIAGFCFCFCFW